MAELLTKKEMAAKLKVTERTVDIWREKGLPCIKVGSVIRFEEFEVLAWLKSQSQSPSE